MIGYHPKFDVSSGNDRPAQIRSNDLFLSDPHYPGLLKFDDKRTLAERICEVLEGTCGEDYYQFDARSDYIVKFMDLPDINLNGDGIYLLTANSMGCRAIHQAMAVIAPETHCPHVSYHSQPDRNGLYKCDAKNINKIYTNFTDEQMSDFRRVATLNGLIDPSMSKWIDVSERNPCKDPNALMILDDLLTSGELSDSFSPICYQFMRERGLGDFPVPMYWVLLWALAVSFRAMFAVGLYWRGKQH